MTAIVDHVGFSVNEFGRARDFYVAALGTLGIRMLVEFEHEGHRHAGFGIDRPEFWIGTGKPAHADGHVAFVARSRAEVSAFYTAAMAAGGRDNGPPGLRPHYHANYFGAFVLDPDGHNVEACCHAPE